MLLRHQFKRLTSTERFGHTSLLLGTSLCYLAFFKGISASKLFPLPKKTNN